MTSIAASSTDVASLASKEAGTVRRDSSSVHSLTTAADLAIKSRYAAHMQPLLLNVKTKCWTVTILDMDVVDAKTGETVFEVRGKATSLRREVHINAKDGKRLYTLKQTTCLRYGFQAVDEEMESKETVFNAKARGGFGNDGFDLDMTVGSGDKAGSERTMHLQTGIAKDESVMTTADGKVVALVGRGKYGLRKSNPAENYRLQVAPGMDASVALLSLICMHVQFVDWKVLGGSFFLAAAGLVGKA